MKEYARLIDTQTLDNGRIVPPKSWIEKLLRRFLPYKEIGWVDIGEVFFRYQIAKTAWFNIYLHQLDAPNWHPVGCHDHPWWFWTVLLKGGYLEKQSIKVYGKTVGTKLTRRYPGQILYRPLGHTQDVVTPYGRSWSLIITGPKSRNWGFLGCEP